MHRSDKVYSYCTEHFQHRTGVTNGISKLKCIRKCSQLTNSSCCLVRRGKSACVVPIWQVFSEWPEHFQKYVEWLFTTVPNFSHAKLWLCQIGQREAAKNDVFANCDENQTHTYIDFFLILRCHRSLVDVDTEQTAVVPCSVLTLAGEQLRPIHGLIGQ